jgi:hypothetical protein
MVAVKIKVNEFPVSSTLSTGINVNFVIVNTLHLLFQDTVTAFAVMRKILMQAVVILIPQIAFNRK